MTLPRALALVSTLAVFASFAAPAQADLPPPDGQKFVGFSFKVTGTGVAPDRVLFAQPCSDSSGVPYGHLAKIEEGRAVSVGRRGGTCAVYSIAKTRFDEFAKDYKPSMQTDDPPARALAAEAKKCEGGPTIQHQLPTKDARTNVSELLTVVKLDATTCVLKSGGIEGGAPAASPAPAAASSSGSNSGKSGGCAITALTPGTAIAIDGAALVAVAAGVLALRRTRRRRVRP